MYQNLDVRTDSQYNLIINKYATLNVNILAQVLSGNTLIDFNFSSYTGATLQVRTKPDAPYLTLGFSTDDGSIVLPTSGGTFNLNKTAEQLQNVRAGEYYYNFDLHSSALPIRRFLSGQFTIIPNITT